MRHRAHLRRLRTGRPRAAAQPRANAMHLTSHAPATTRDRRDGHHDLGRHPCRRPCRHRGVGGQSPHCDPDPIPTECLPDGHGLLRRDRPARPAATGHRHHDRHARHRHVPRLRHRRHPVGVRRHAAHRAPRTTSPTRHRATRSGGPLRHRAPARLTCPARSPPTDRPPDRAREPAVAPATTPPRPTNRCHRDPPRALGPDPRTSHATRCPKAPTVRSCRPVRRGAAPTTHAPTENGPTGNGRCWDDPTGNGRCWDDPTGNGRCWDDPTGNGRCWDDPTGNGPKTSRPRGRRSDRAPVRPRHDPPHAEHRRGS